MSAYSLGRVAQYARYHYTSQTKNYLSLFLVCVAMPVLFGILSRDVYVAIGISTAIYTLGGLAYALRTTYAMRHRGTKVMECSLPVSNEERMTFMLCNLAVGFPLFVAITAVLGVAIVYPFSYTDADLVVVLSQMINDTFMRWQLYVFVQIVTSMSLLLNIVARRSLFMAYLGTFIGFVLLIGIVARVGAHVLMNVDPYVIESIHFDEDVAVVVYILIPVMLYALSYWALRRRQMRW
ncbi:MAG: hypothetical protein IJB56_01705 [Alistipes sp.]|nr:hypothetical protein [Alistipes sp.]